MIPNHPNMQQAAAMPEYYQQHLMSPNQEEINTTVESENAPKTHCHCCVDLSHMYDFHHMHDFYDMHDFHYMHDFHHMHDHHHMHDDHLHPHEGWDFTSIDYHHEWFHPYVHLHHMHHMHHMHHPICLPVVCYPVDKD